MVKPLITTIIPTFRRPRLLRRALTSVLNQSFPHFTVKVYDNASNDETETVVREFMKKDSRVEYHCHPENIGMMGNYKYALNEVATPYFSLLSDDDVLFPWFYDVALEGFKTCPEAAFSAASTIIMSETGRVIRVPLDLWNKEGVHTAPDGLLEMISKYPVPTTVLFRQKATSTIPIDTENNLVWDCDFLLQIAAEYPIVISKRPCGILLHHNSSYSNTQSFERWAAALKRLLEKLNLQDRLSSATKTKATKLIENELKTVHIASTIRALFNRKFNEASSYADQFRENYGLSWYSLLLLTATKSAKLFPPAVSILKLLRMIARFPKKTSQSSYQEYQNWIDIK
jgi:hypothetical protein